MKKQNIRDVCNIRNGFAFKSSDFKEAGIPIVRIGEIKRNGKVDISKSPLVEKSKKYSQYVLSKGDVLIAMSGATTGKIGIFDIDEDAYQNQRVGCFKPDKNILNNEYLFHFLKSISDSITKSAYGGGQPNISSKEIGKFKIPLPSLTDQKRIAKVLSDAEQLISQRKESITLLDELLKSTFLDMFGEPVRNNKRWNINSLANYGSFKNGLNFSKNETGFSFKYLGVGDFKNLSRLSEISLLSVVSLSNQPSEGFFLKDNDLVFVRSNGNKRLVGRCIVVFPKEEKITYSGFCIRYRLNNNDLNAIFLSHLFRVSTFKNRMLQNGRGANIQNINQKLLNELKIPIPPITIQTKFAQIVEKTEAIKKQYQESLQELENLYASLSQCAFKGELDLSGVLVEEEFEALGVVAESVVGYGKK